MRIMFSVVAGALLAGLILAIIGAINAGSIESKTPSTFYVSLENVYPHHTSTVKLPVYNPGNEPANVETWETSCSCSMPKSAPKTVPPKATVAYTVTLDTWAMHERFKRGGKVALVPILETNGGKSCRSPPVELRFTFREAFERSPDRLVFLRRNTPKQITLRSRIPGGQFAIVSSPDWLKSEISPTQENDVWGPYLHGRNAEIESDESERHVGSQEPGRIFPSTRRHTCPLIADGGKGGLFAPFDP